MPVPVPDVPSDKQGLKDFYGWDKWWSVKRVKSVWALAATSPSHRIEFFCYHWELWISKCNFHLQAFQSFMQNRPWAWDLSAAATYRRRLYLITIFGISFNLPRKCRNSEDWVTSLREKAKLFLCWNIEVGCGEWRARVRGGVSSGSVSPWCLCGKWFVWAGISW